MKKTIISILLSALMLFSLCGCSREHTRLDQGETAQTQPTAQNREEKEDFTIPAPAFRTGSYVMTASDTSNTGYSYEGSDAGQYKSVTTYQYDLDITVNGDGSLTALYTYKRATVEDDPDAYNGTVIDTDDPSGKNDETSLFYDLIGKSFTVSIDSEMNITGLTADDGLKDITGSDSLIAIARDLFYPLPDTISSSESWHLESLSGSNTYSPEKLRGDMVGITITGQDNELPPAVTSENGSVTTYTSYPPLSGSLWMNTDDRAVQQLSVSQIMAGIYSVQYEDVGTIDYDFEIKSYTVCTITKK